MDHLLTAYWSYTLVLSMSKASLLLVWCSGVIPSRKGVAHPDAGFTFCSLTCSSFALDFRNKKRNKKNNNECRHTVHDARIVCVRFGRARCRYGTAHLAWPGCFDINRHNWLDVTFHLLFWLTKPTDLFFLEKRLLCSRNYTRLLIGSGYNDTLSDTWEAAVSLRKSCTDL